MPSKRPLKENDTEKPTAKTPKLHKSVTNEEGVINDPELLASLFVRLDQIQSGEIIEDKVVKFKLTQTSKYLHPIYFIALNGKKTFIAIPPKSSTEITNDITLNNTTDEVMSVILQNDGSYGLAPLYDVLGITLSTTDGIFHEE